MSMLTDELRARIGEQRVYTAPEELGRASIRYFARATGDDNRLYIDDEYARQWGHDGIIAPPTLVCETNQYADVPRDQDGFAGHRWDLEVPGTRQVRGGNSYEFHRAVRPSDVITARWVLADMTERTTRDGRAMLVVTSRAEYTNQGGDLLATNEEQVIYVSLEAGDR
jgi:acyl dehydratase